MVLLGWSSAIASVCEYDKNKEIQEYMKILCGVDLLLICTIILCCLFGFKNSSSVASKVVFCLIIPIAYDVVIIKNETLTEPIIKFSKSVIGIDLVMISIILCIIITAFKEETNNFKKGFNKIF